MSFHLPMDKMNNFLDGDRRVKRSKVAFFLKIFKITLIVFLFLIFIFIALSSLAFFKFKNIYDTAALGRASLEYSISNARRGDFTEMTAAALRADNYFNNILSDLDKISNNALLNSNALARGQVAEMRYLVTSAAVVSKSIVEVGRIMIDIDNVLSGKLGENFSEFTTAEKQQFLQTIYEAGPELNGIKANLELGLINLNQVHANVVFLPFKDKINEVRDKLETAVASLSKLVIASELLPELAGYPGPSTWLVLFQNNTELRATGGFLGTYGILETNNGDIIRFDTHDVYHMDMPMELNNLLVVEPPAPIKKYLNKNWYLRDANWSPDWPTAAQKIDWFYHEENKRLPEENQINDFAGEFNGIIAITPELVTGLLSVVGDVVAAGDNYNTSNFTNLLEYKVEQDFAVQNISAWERKEIIGDVLEAIKIKMFNLHYSQWSELANVLADDVLSKDVLVYFADENLQRLGQELKVSGEIKQTNGDYLMVVDSNMAALKTDAVMERDIKYSVEKVGDKLVARLKLDYQNNGTKTWRTGDYHSYTRIYVPQGSKLLQTQGLAQDRVDIADELGKTYFGGFFSVRTGQEASLYFEYELPASIQSQIEQQYALYVQKQPGRKTRSLVVDFSLGSDVKSYQPAEGVKGTLGALVWETGLEQDREFIVNFK